MAYVFHGVASSPSLHPYHGCWCVGFLDVAASFVRAPLQEASERASKVKSLDVCFVLDSTNSMQPYIDSVKRKISEINAQIEMPCCSWAGCDALLASYRF